MPPNVNTKPNLIFSTMAVLGASFFLSTGPQAWLLRFGYGVFVLSTEKIRRFFPTGSALGSLRIGLESLRSRCEVIRSLFFLLQQPRTKASGLCERGVHRTHFESKLFVFFVFFSRGGLRFTVPTFLLLLFLFSAWGGGWVLLIPRPPVVCPLSWKCLFSVGTPFLVLLSANR